MAFINWWTKLSSIGLPTDQSNISDLQVKLMNQFHILGIIGSIFAGIVFLFSGNELLLPFTGISGMLGVCSLWFSYRQQFYRSWHVSLIGLSALVAIGSWFVEGTKMQAMYFLVYLALATFLFKESKTRVFYIIFFLVCAFLTIASYLLPNSPIISANPALVDSVIFLVVLSFELAILYFYLLEQKLEAKRLKKSRYLTDEAQSLAKIGSWEYDFELGEFHFSKQMLQMFGIPPHTVLTLESGLSYFLSEQEWQKIHTKNQSPEVNKTFEFRYNRNLNNQPKWFQINGKRTFNELGKLIKLTGTVQDISEQIEKDTKIEYGRSLMQAALESTADGILVINLEKEITLYNQKFLKMLNVPTHVIESDNCKTLVEHIVAQLVNPEEFLSMNRQMYDELSSVTFTILDFKDGRILERYSQPQYINGEVVGRVVSYRDVTEKKQSEKKINQLLASLTNQNLILEEKVAQRTLSLQKSNEELTRSNKDLEQFAYAASHDLQEPLRMVGSFTQLIKKKYEPLFDESGQEYIGFVVQGVKRMAGLIKALLEYSRVGRKEMNFNPVNINALISHKMRDLRHRINETNTKVEVQNLPDELICEPNQIGIVFHNLIVNAIKFNKSPQPMVEISAEERERDWLFKISDNGIGISVEHQEQIFEIFRRLHLKEEYEGTGIGLALCKKIINRHSGEIWLSSQPQIGSTFYFTLSKEMESKESNNTKLIGNYIK